MALQPIDQTNYGISLPTTWVMDVQELQDTEFGSEQFKKLLERLYQNLNRMCEAIAAKENGYYAQNQYVTGQQYFPNPATLITAQSTVNYRQSFRVAVNFGALPNTGTKSVAHNIPFNLAYTLTDIWGAATDPVSLDYIPLPYSSASGTTNIELYADGTNVNVITASDRSAFTTCIIVVEFLKN